MLIFHVHLHLQQLFIFTVHALTESYLMYCFSFAEVINPEVSPALDEDLHRLIFFKGAIMQTYSQWDLCA